MSERLLDLDQLNACLSTQKDVPAAYLFGSQATGKVRSDSGVFFLDNRIDGW